MATAEPGFDDVAFDLLSAHRCHQFVRELGGTDNTSPQR